MMATTDCEGFAICLRNSISARTHMKLVFQRLLQGRIAIELLYLIVRTLIEPRGWRTGSDGSIRNDDRPFAWIKTPHATEM